MRQPYAGDRLAAIADGGGFARARRELIAGLAALCLSPALAEPLIEYQRHLARWNRAYNLTAVRDPEQMARRHLLDSLAVLPYVETPLLDVGSGAGLPGLPLAIARPDLAVTLLDAAGKKARFLRHIVRELRLPNVEVVESRIENYRPQRPFATVISRAFSSLGDFLRLTASLVTVDGRWLAMKATLARDELETLPAGLAIREIQPLHVPGLAEQRQLVIVVRDAEDAG